VRERRFPTNGDAFSVSRNFAGPAT
jgi:hypothetical protein